jgi:uncharacterized protein (DUF58 family)
VEHLIDGALLDAVRGLHWPARRITRASHTGGSRSKRIGQSPEFVQYREYRPGDDTSKIDWKLYGRTARVAVRQTRDESNLRTMILVDASASMAYPETDLGKWKLAAALAFGLAGVTQADRDPVGLAVVSGDNVAMLPPRSRASATANILHVLRSVIPAGSRPLAPVLESLTGNDRIAIVSDFLGDEESMLRVAARSVAAGREVFGIHVVAREELDPVSAGSIVVDPEESSMRRPFHPSDVEAYSRAFARWREEVSARWRAAGVVFQQAIADEPPELIIRRIVTPAATGASW